MFKLPPPPIISNTGGIGTFGDEGAWESWAMGQWAAWVEYKINQLMTPGSHEFAYVMAESANWFRTAFALDVWKTFTTGRSPAGKKWRKLKYRSGQPLILTGKLFAATVDAARNRTRSYGSFILMDMGHNAPFYWYFHEFGTKTIPARPFFGPRPATVVGLAGVVGYNVMRVITGK